MFYLNSAEKKRTKSESVELGIIPIESVILEIPMMRASKSISTSAVGTTKQ